MSAREKLNQLEQFALAVAKATMRLDGIAPQGTIHVQLPPGYWHDRVGDMLRDEHRSGEWVSQMRDGSFELCGVTFHNSKQLPAWMK